MKPTRSAASRRRRLSSLKRTAASVAAGLALLASCDSGSSRAPSTPPPPVVPPPPVPAGLSAGAASRYIDFPVDGGEETVVIAHLDAIFPLLALRNRVVERVKEHTGVDLTQNLLLTASHSHQSGAPYWNNFLVSVGGMDAYDEEIFQRFAQSIARAIEDALAARAQPINHPASSAHAT